MGERDALDEAAGLLKKLGTKALIVTNRYRVMTGRAEM